MTKARLHSCHPGKQLLLAPLPARNSRVCMQCQWGAKTHTSPPANLELNLRSLLCRLRLADHTWNFPEARQEPSGSAKGSICFLQEAINCLGFFFFFFLSLRRASCTTPRLPRNIPLLTPLSSSPDCAKLQVAPLISNYAEKFLDSILKTKLIPFPFIFESA